MCLQFVDILELWIIDYGLWSPASSDGVQMFDLPSLGLSVKLSVATVSPSLKALKLKLINSSSVKRWPLCHHHVWWKRERRGLIWKIVCGPIYQMLPPPSHFEHKHKKIYFRTLFLSYMGTESFKRQKILGNQNSLCIFFLKMCFKVLRFYGSS